MQKNIIKTLFIFCVIFSSAGLYAQDGKVLGVHPDLIDKAVEGKKLLFERRYTEAMNLFKQLEKEYPDSPTGLAGQTAVWLVKMFEHDDLRFKPEYQAAERLYNKFAIRQLRRGDVPSWDLFVYGAADGMRGFFATREEKWFSALSSALHAVRMLKQLKFQEPDFVDVDMGLGAYMYWRSVVTKEVNILPFFSDRRQEGIDMVKRVVNEGKYTSDVALSNLVYIYGQEEDYNKAISAADRVLAIYPQSLIIKYLKGKILTWAKRCDEAIAIFKSVYSANSTIYKALLYEGINLAQKKDYPSAKSVLEKYIGIDKDREGLSIAYYWLGWIAEAEKNKEEAINYYKKALKKNHKLKPAKTRLAKLQ